MNNYNLFYTYFRCTTSQYRKNHSSSCLSRCHRCFSRSMPPLVNIAVKILFQSKRLENCLTFQVAKYNLATFWLYNTIVFLQAIKRKYIRSWQVYIRKSHGDDSITHKYCYYKLWVDSFPGVWCRVKYVHITQGSIAQSCWWINPTLKRHKGKRSSSCAWYCIPCL